MNGNTPHNGEGSQIEKAPPRGTYKPSASPNSTSLQAHRTQIRQSL